MPIDVAEHLQNKNYPRIVQAKRVLWGAANILFLASPRFLPEWRNFLLRCFGATIGRGVRLDPSVAVTFPWNLQISDHVVVGRSAKLYALAPITIEPQVLISQGAHLCAGSHDYRRRNFPIAHAPIRICSGTWIAAEAFVGPGVTIGAGCVVGARAVVMRDIEPRCVAVGNPAQVTKRLNANDG